jgi:hypothetical protein
MRIRIRNPLHQSYHKIIHYKNKNAISKNPKISNGSLKKQNSRYLTSMISSPSLISWPFSCLVNTKDLQEKKL